MEFTPEKRNALSMEFTPDPDWNFDTHYTGDRELDQYVIKNMTLQFNNATVYVEITFGRSLTSIILNIYFISFICTVVGHMTVIYRDQYFETQVSLNVIIMLVQVTIFTAVS